MKQILSRLFDYDTLTESEAYDSLNRLSAGEYNIAQMTSFLTVFNMRDITVNELKGFRQALLDLWGRRETYLQYFDIGLFYRSWGRVQGH